jgi:retron-type reverse transcriptase
VKRLKREIKDEFNTRYCLKLDIRKFYPNINHDILKKIIRRKIKDPDLLWLLDSIIDSADGVPIGNYLSQYFANLYLAYFDHWIKEEKKVRFYYRYADDMIILDSSKEVLHQLRIDIAKYFESHLKLQLKDNYQVFPVKSRGIDFVGYRFFHTHTLLRKSIKQNFARALKGNTSNRRQVIAAYWGWAKHCDSLNLLRKLAS